MTDEFGPPAKPDMVYAHIHTHQWVEVGADKQVNGTWNSLWACELCPDIGIGGKVGPVPAGYCRCGWVNRPAWTKATCEDCGRPLEGANDGKG